MTAANPGRAPVLGFFGTYDPDTPRVDLLARGWRAHGGVVIQVHAAAWPPAGERARRAAGGALGLGWRWLRAQATLWQARSQLRGVDFLLVPYPGHLDMPLAAWLGQRYHKPVVFDPFISLYDTAVEDRRLFSPGGWRARACLALDRVALGRADRVLADTAGHAAYFEALAGLDASRSRVVPVGADEAHFRAGPLPGGDCLQVLFYGRMIPLHGVETVVAAAARLADRTDIAFHVVGTGQVDIARLVAGAPNVTWTPEVAFADLPATIAAADVSLGVFGTSSKAARVVPHKVYEAAAMGRAIVTADTPAMRAAFPEDALVLVPAGDDAALAAAIAALADDPARRAALGARAAAHAAAHYGVVGIGAALVAAVVGL